MALETTATIRARDETAAAFNAIKAHVEALDKQLAGVNKTIAAVGKVDGRSGGLINILEHTDRAVKHIAATSAGLRGEFDRLNLAQAKLGAFRGMTEGFARARKGFNAAKSDVELLGREMRIAESATTKLSDAHKKAQERAERLGREMLTANNPTGALTEQYKKAQAAVERLGRESPTAKVSDVYRNAERAVETASRTFETQKAAMAGLKSEFESLAGPLSSISGAEARLAGEIERVTSALRAQGVAATRTAEELAMATRREEEVAHRRANRREAIGMIGAFAGIALGHEVERGAKDVVETYRDFDKERRYMKAVMNITDDQQKPLVDQAIHGGSTTKFNDIQFLEAQRELAARGLNIGQILGMVPSGANLGMATDQDLPASVRQLESGIFGFKKDTSTEAAAIASAKRTADVMVKASKISGMTPEDEVQLYKRGANPAHLAGVSEESMLAFGGTLKRANIGGDEASTAFRALIAAGLSPTAGAKTALLANGLNYKNYQSMRDHLDVGPFVEDVAAKYGVKLNQHAQAALGKVFGNKDLIADPAKFAPAILKVLSGALGGADAKSKKSIAGEAGRYRAASATGVDFNALLRDLMKVLPGNLALANALFGAKQGGRISTALADPEVFNRMVDALKNHSEGYAPEIAKERMAGFDGAMSELEGSIKNVATSIGRAWDADGKGGPLTDVAKFAGNLAQHFAELDGRVIQVSTGLAAVGATIAAAWGSWKVAQMLFGLGGGGAGMTVAATALDGSAVALDGSAAALSRAAAALAFGGKTAAPAAVATGGAATVAGGVVEGAAAAGGGGWLARMLGLPGMGSLGGLATAARFGVGGLIAAVGAYALGEANRADADLPPLYKGKVEQDLLTLSAALDRAYKDQDGPLGFRADPGAAHGRAYHGAPPGEFALVDPGYHLDASRAPPAAPLDVNVTGLAQVETKIVIEAGSELFRVLSAVQTLIKSVPLAGNLGRSDAGLAPNGRGGTWDR